MATADPSRRPARPLNRDRINSYVDQMAQGPFLEGPVAADAPPVSGQHRLAELDDDDISALRAEILAGWWEVDQDGRDQALARLDRIAAELKKARAEALGMTMRGDNVDAWLKRRRDWYERGESAYIALDDALDDYRAHADTGTPLADDVQSPYADAPAALKRQMQVKMTVRAQDDQPREDPPWTHGTRLGREHRSVRDHLVEDHGVSREQVDAWSDGGVHGHHDGVHRKVWAYSADLPHPAPGDILFALNEYTGGNVWEDVIHGSGVVDYAATEAIDGGGMSDRFVTTSGVIVRHDAQTGQWSEAGHYEPDPEGGDA